MIDCKIKVNEFSSSTRPGEPAEDGEMNEMTLPSRPLNHGDSPQYWIITSERGQNLCSFETWMPDEPAISNFPGRQV